MIDGFGWFKEADYRRSWLFFDEVEYILPESSAGPLVYPPRVFERQDCRVVFPTLTGDEVSRIIQRATEDASDLTFREMVANKVPRKDLEYAALVIASDRQLRDQVPQAHAQDAVFALALLINKLILCSARSGALPIVGRDYAPPLIARKLDKWIDTERQERNLPIVDPKTGLSFAGFEAGLSFDFLSADALSSIPIERLAKFKDRNQKLLEKHRISILEVAQKYQGLPTGEGFGAALSDLRLQAAKQRQELDDQAREEWLSMGMEIAKKALLAASASAATGVAILRGHSFTDLMGLALPATASGIGVAAVATMDAIKQIHYLRLNNMAYLFELQKLVSRRA
jgi:hypothetical protein